MYAAICSTKSLPVHAADDRRILSAGAFDDEFPRNARTVLHGQYDPGTDTKQGFHLGRRQEFYNPRGGTILREHRVPLRLDCGAHTGQGSARCVRPSRKQVMKNFFAVLANRRAERIR